MLLNKEFTIMRVYTIDLPRDLKISSFYSKLNAYLEENNLRRIGPHTYLYRASREENNIEVVYDSIRIAIMPHDWLAIDRNYFDPEEILRISDLICRFLTDNQLPFNIYADYRCSDIFTTHTKLMLHDVKHFTENTWPA